MREYWIAVAVLSVRARTDNKLVVAQSPSAKNLTILTNLIEVLLLTICYPGRKFPSRNGLTVQFTAIMSYVVSDTSRFVLKRSVKFQPTNHAMAFKLSIKWSIIVSPGSVVHR